MMPFLQMQASVFDSAFACGFRDEFGKIRASWGGQPGQKPHSEMNLSFSFFHKGESAAGRDSIWRGIPCEGAISGDNFFQSGDIPATPPSAFQLDEVREEPSYDEWEKFCGRITHEIGAKTLKKVVPARSNLCRLSPEQEAHLKKNLLEKIFSAYSPGTFPFFLKWQEEFFFGISPELLFKRSADKLYVPAIAGTRKIPADRIAAQEIARGLLLDEKERYEHQLVVDGILQSLAGIGIKAQAASKEPEALFLRGLVHLKTEIHASHGGVKSEEIIKALHPTPAVCGYPKDLSMQFLAAHEPFDRGLFASPLLFSQEKEDYCIVAIRSALWSKGSLVFMAGAGFVRGSTAEGEWSETARKMDFLRGLLEARA